MIVQIPVQEDNIVAFRISGKLTHEDYQAFLPRLESLIQKNGRLSVLIELHDFKGWDLEAAWDDFRLLEEHPDAFERIAVVGKGRLMRWMTAMTTPFVGAEVRYFEEDELSKAWDWLRERRLKELAARQPPAPYRQILVGTEFTAEGRRVVQRAVDIMRCYADARIHLIHAVDYPVYIDEAYDPVIPLEIEDELTSIAQKHLDDLLRELDDQRITGDIVPGPPRGVILSQAEALRADLIVLGKHGHGALGRLLGSTASGVINHARCEVLTIPLQETVR
ncbi:MAG: hypothetical protein D6720_06400 [Gammaproteobacteria bacterium]|nr:MAG: hypothetical protein D6720_06400 [Gammaproteobacteria bacterium]